MTTNDNEPVLTITDLMKRWKCTRNSILEVIKRGELAPFKIGKRVYRVRLAEVERFELEGGNAKLKAA